MSALTRLVPLAAIVVSLPAEAGQNEEAVAEHTRLSEEMRKLASRNAWRGVEASYVRALDLEKKGATLTYDDHMYGVQAARDLGDITRVRERLERAKNVNPTKEVLDWMADIDSNYGRVFLQKDLKYKGGDDLTVEVMPFAPDQRASIGTAKGLLEQNGEYRGLLPFGKYAYGGVALEVTQGGDEVGILLDGKGSTGPTKDGPKVRRRDGFRVDVGGLYSAVSENENAPTVSPRAYSGFGLRAGLGWEVEIAGNLGVLAQAGYHGMLVGSPKDAPGGEDQAIEGSDSRLSLFYVWGAPTFWLGDLGLAAGPSWAIGRGSTTGIIGSGTGDLTELEQQRAATEAAVMAPGLAAGVFYGFMPFPGMPSARLGVSLNGGAQLDGTNSYPWAQLALGVAPSK